MYVGEHVHGLYALPSLVDENVVTITNSLAGPLLLEGPGSPDVPQPYRDHPVAGHNYQIPPGTSIRIIEISFSKIILLDLYKLDPVVFQSMPDFKGKFVIFLGHYNVPEYANMQFFIGGRTESTKLLTDASIENKPYHQNGKSIGVQTEPLQGSENEIKLEVKVETLSDSIKYTYNNFKMFINMQENKGLKLTLIVLVGCIIAMFWYLQMQVFTLNFY